MTIDDLFVLLALHATDDGFDAAAVQAVVERGFAVDFATTVQRGLAYDWVRVERYFKATSAEFPQDFPKALGILLTQLADSGLFPYDLIAHQTLDSIDSMRLWAYAEPWLLSEQDEDLLLMDKRYYHDFLRISAEVDCPKSGYMLDVVEHSIRDQAHTLIGTPAYPRFAAELGQYIEPARTAKANRLVDYLERLIQYASWTRWNKRTAQQLGSDLTRCVAPPVDTIQIAQSGDGWLVTTGGSPYATKQLRIDRRSGTISAENQK